MHLEKIKFQEGIYNSQLNSAQGEWLAWAQRLLKLLFAQVFQRQEPGHNPT